ncbi:MAG: hypothetical protein KAS36_07875 [Anaerolineales bacterium]|nr:hypothetical protein [Anaerolineales bacterium]
MAQYEEQKIAECRMYTACWGFAIVNISAIMMCLISTAEGVAVGPPVVAASIVAIVGNPCVVLAAWGDCVNNVIDSVLNLFKRKGKE